MIAMVIVSTKKTNTTATNVTSTASKFKSKILLYIAHSFIRDHFTIDNNYYLLLLCKSKRYNTKWKITKLKTFVLEIVRVIISMT